MEHINHLLTDFQSKALVRSIKKSKLYSKSCSKLLLSKIINMGYTKTHYENLLSYMKFECCLISHFSIDVLNYWKTDTNMRSIFEVIEKKGIRYIESRILWEKNLFGDIYDYSPSIDRPKYATLNLTNNISGVSACTGYGQCYVVYKKHIRNRITFVFGDTCLMEKHIATLQGFSHILYYVNNKLLKDMLKISNKEIESSELNYSPYLDVQIHGPIIIDDDFESINIPHKYKNDQNIKLFCENHPKVKVIYF